MAPRQGRELKTLVARLETALAQQPIEIRSPDFLIGKTTGEPREVDVSVRGRIGATQLLIILECRDRGSPQDITWIEQLASKRDEVGADKVIAVSTQGFTAGARKLAAGKNVLLRTVADVTQRNFQEWLTLDNVELTSPGLSSGLITAR